MSRTITFNELRRIKNRLPEGSIHAIADKLNLPVQSVRNYFGGSNYEFGTNQYGLPLGAWPRWRTGRA